MNEIQEPSAEPVAADQRPLEPPPANEPTRAGSYVGGVILIVLGVLFLLHNLDIRDFGDLVRRYWPMIIVAVGATKLSQAKTFWSGLWVIAVGSWLQLVNLRLFGLTYRNSWPLLLIALGAGTILHALVDASRGSRSTT